MLDDLSEGWPLPASEERSTNRGHLLGHLFSSHLNLWQRFIGGEGKVVVGNEVLVLNQIVDDCKHITKNWFDGKLLINIFLTTALDKQEQGKMQPKLYTSLFWILRQESEAEQGTVNKPQQDGAAHSKLEPPQQRQQ